MESILEAIGERCLASRFMIHVAGLPSSDGVTGLSCLTDFQGCDCQSLAIQRHSNLYFKNASQPTGILSTTEKLKPEDRSMIRENWEKLVGGISKFRTAVLDNSLTYTPINPTNNIDSDLVKAREHSRQAVCSPVRRASCPHCLRSEDKW